ncbi:hypothetical protein [Mesorhizobium kowhaii]|uniref:Uncharacterized protein n=1 Tax=Mesorhizobium kowhaii TaxID=1300272 RepID=A0A2W7E8I9_9HYPH|nr:hypothetical protein [Mesorhizobium kowhaii]PZV39516.1 hypothetical protein B5V02_06005 [Mesorhizobium kowhaii]
MSERTSGRPGILESTAIVLAIAVACLTTVRAEPGLRGCTPVSRDGAPARTAPDTASPDTDATDMLLHD